MKVDDIIKSQQLKLIFEFKNNRLPLELQKLFKFTNQKHSYETTSASKEFLFIPQINTVSHGNKSIKYRSPYLWNEICKNNPKALKSHLSKVNLLYIQNKRGDLIIPQNQ